MMTTLTNTLPRTAYSLFTGKPSSINNEINRPLSTGPQHTSTPTDHSAKNIRTKIETLLRAFEPAFKQAEKAATDSSVKPARTADDLRQQLATQIYQAIRQESSRGRGAKETSERSIADLSFPQMRPMIDNLIKEYRDANDRMPITYWNILEKMLPDCHKMTERELSLTPNHEKRLKAHSESRQGWETYLDQFAKKFDSLAQSKTAPPAAAATHDAQSKTASRATTRDAQLKPASAAAATTHVVQSKTTSRTTTRDNLPPESLPRALDTTARTMTQNSGNDPIKAIFNDLLPKIRQATVDETRQFRLAIRDHLQRFGTIDKTSRDNLSGTSQRKLDDLYKELTTRLYQVVHNNAASGSSALEANKHLRSKLEPLIEAFRTLNNRIGKRYWQIVKQQIPNFDKLSRQEQYSPSNREIMKRATIESDQENEQALAEFTRNVQDVFRQKPESIVAPPAKAASAAASFAQLSPRISEIVARVNAQPGLRDQARKEIHNLLRLPESERTRIRLIYTNPSGSEPYGHQELTQAIKQIVNDFIKGNSDWMALKARTGASETRAALQALRDVDSASDTLFTDNIVAAKNLLQSIEHVMGLHSDKTIRAYYALEAVKNGLLTAIEWSEADATKRQRLLTIPPSHQEGLDFATSITSRRVLESRDISVANQPYNTSAYPDINFINISRRELASRQALAGGSNEAWAVAHELAHCIESRNPELLERSVHFRAKRSFASTVNKDRMLEGNWVQKGGIAYSGMVYRDEEGWDTGSEVLSTGIGRLYTDPVEFFKNDPEFFAYTVDALRGH